MPVSSGFFLLFCFLAFGIFYPMLDGTLSRTDNSKKKTARSKSGADGAIDPTVVYSDIVLNYNKADYKEMKKFRNAVLGYVTPWNNWGYDVAKFMAQKFDFIAPVWFQLRRINDNYVISGTHDLDQGWIKDIRRNNSQIKIVPRFLFDHWTPSDYDHLLLLEYEQEKCAKVVLDFLRRNEFDGLVLELWIQAISMTAGKHTEELTHFIVHFSEIIHSKQKLLILVVPPILGSANEPNLLYTPVQHSHLSDAVDFFSVMTYDYPNKRAGPVAPIIWVRQCLEALISADPSNANKLLIGLNFYGYEYVPATAKMEAVTGKRFIETLQQHKCELRWNKQAMEHYLELTDGRVIYYPSLQSLEARLSLAIELGVGVAIWEMGQGLDYFYNLL